jgi:membrane-bound lytic murein transglycosylase D
VEFIRVREGQTIEKLARKYDIKARRLRRWNYIGRGKQPKPGMHLALVRPRRSQVHVARRWETLTEIAARYHRNPRRLVRLNNMESTEQLLVEGQKIYLRSHRPEGEPVTIYTSPRDDLVPWEDVPQDIAKRSVPASELSASTGSKPSAPEASTEPKAEPAPGTAPKVDSDDSEKPKAPADATPEKPAPESATKTPEIPATHTVKAGETLYQISRKYGVSVQELQTINKLPDFVISVGQVLKLR